MSLSTHMHINVCVYIYIYKYRYRQAGRQAGRQTDRQAGNRASGFLSGHVSLLLLVYIGSAVLVAIVAWLLRTSQVQNRQPELNTGDDGDGVCQCAENLREGAEDTAHPPLNPKP